MRILEPNNGKEFVPILKHHSYVRANDTKQKLFLKEIKIGTAQYTWEWVSLMPDHYVDLKGIGERYCTFDHAINKVVNDPYCTVYEFDSYSEMIDNWSQIKYVDSITTVYQSSE